MLSARVTCPRSVVFAKDIVWHVPGKSFLAKDYRGQEDVFGFLGRLMELTNGTFQVDSRDVLANDRGGVFVDRLTAQRDARTLDVSLLLHVVIEDGRIVEGFDHFHPEHVWDASRSQENKLHPGAGKAGKS